MVHSLVAAVCAARSLQAQGPKGQVLPLLRAAVELLSVMIHRADVGDEYLREAMEGMFGLLGAAGLEEERLALLQVGASWLERLEGGR